MIRDQIRQAVIDAVAAAQASQAICPRSTFPRSKSNAPINRNTATTAPTSPCSPPQSVRKSTGGKVNPRQIAQAIVNHLAGGEFERRTDAPTRLAASSSPAPASSTFASASAGCRTRCRQLSRPAQISAPSAQGELDSAGRSNTSAPIRPDPSTTRGGRNAVLGDTLANLSGCRRVRGTAGVLRQRQRQHSSSSS